MLWAMIVVAVAGVAAQMLRMRESRRRGIPAVEIVRDPRALAWMRGGRPALLQVALYDLLRRGQIQRQVNGHVLTEQKPEFERLTDLDTAVLLACERPASWMQVWGNALVQRRAAEAERELRERLARAGLSVPATEADRRIGRAGWSLILLAVLGILAGLGAKAAEARPIVATFIAAMMTHVICVVLPLRTTEAGDEALAQVERETARDRLRLLYGTGGSCDPVLMLAAGGTEPAEGRAGKERVQTPA